MFFTKKSAKYNRIDLYLIQSLSWMANYRMFSIPKKVDFGLTNVYSVCFKNKLLFEHMNYVKTQIRAKRDTTIRPVLKHGPRSSTGV